MRNLINHGSAHKARRPTALLVSLVLAGASDTSNRRNVVRNPDRYLGQALQAPIERQVRRIHENLR